MVHYPIEQLAALFREAGAAHHKAFAATDGEDPDWPSWYARYLAPRLQQALGGFGGRVGSRCGSAPSWQRVSSWRAQGAVAGVLCAVVYWPAAAVTCCCLTSA